MDTDKQREAFEAEYCKRVGGLPEVIRYLRDGEGYIDNTEGQRLTAAWELWQAALTQPAGEPTTAEQKLAKAGVFKGATGLRKLSQAREFWEKQPYGTRLYYGPQADDYLHRGVLEAAVRIMDAQPQPAAPESSNG